MGGKRCVRVLCVEMHHRVEHSDHRQRENFPHSHQPSNAQKDHLATAFCMCCWYPRLPQIHVHICTQIMNICMHISTNSCTGIHVQTLTYMHTNISINIHRYTCNVYMYKGTGIDIHNAHAHTQNTQAHISVKSHVAGLPLSPEQGKTWPSPSHSAMCHSACPVLNTLLNAPLSSFQLL